MRVTDWLGGFLTRHMGRFPGDWPRDDGDRIEYRKLWLSALVRAECREADADATSIRMAENPPSYRRDHLPRFLKTLQALRAEQGLVNGADTREAARAASLDCVHCGGHGLTTAWHPRPDYARRIPATVAAYCVCRSGKWVRRNHEQSKEAATLVTAFADLGRILDGLDSWLTEPPKRGEE